MIDIDKSPTLARYKNTLKEVILLYYPTASPEDLNKAIDYSINKRIKNANIRITNSYKRYRVIEDNKLKYKDLEQNSTLLEIADYIAKRKPIVTPYGTMFVNHAAGIPNPMSDVIQSFLKLRSVHKNQMFQYPKGSEDFEKYNLLQSLT